VWKWTRHVGGTYIVVADEESSKNYVLKTLMKSATPVGVRSSVLSVPDAAELLNSPKLSREKTLVIMKDPKTVLELIDNGVAIEVVNVGNMRSEEGKKKITSFTFVTEEDIGNLKELISRGVQVVAQWLPGETMTDVNKLI
jgi:mannose/fructose/N-acetylgalactosamine-specific phosphotransferase system component IIB